MEGNLTGLGARIIYVQNPLEIAFAMCGVASLFTIYIDDIDDIPSHILSIHFLRSILNRSPREGLDVKF